MSCLCGILHEIVVGSKRTAEYFLETKTQNYLKFWILMKNFDNFRFLKKYCILSESKKLRKNAFQGHFYVKVSVSQTELQNIS